MENPPEPVRKGKEKKGKKKDKVRSAWISFVGRILAQVIGAAATVALGILVATRMQASRAPEPAPPPVVASRPPGATLSIAVLPLQNLSGDPKQEYFADGMTDALIADLAQMRGARVISRTSSMSYKGRQKALPQIARELGVDFIVEGSVVRDVEALAHARQAVLVDPLSASMRMGARPRPLLRAAVRGGAVGICPGPPALERGRDLLVYYGAADRVVAISASMPKTDGRELDPAAATSPTADRPSGRPPR